jgi:hypothetical protein
MQAIPDFTGDVSLSFTMLLLFYGARKQGTEISRDLSFQ